jgi:hypothetical protein
VRKQCKRKIWKLLDPVAHALQGAAITPSEALDKLRMKELAAIDAFAKGHATLADWNALVALLNLTEQLAKSGVGPEAMEACEAAQSHLIEASRRYQTTRKMGTTGPGLQALRDLYEFHDLQRQSISRREYERAIVATTARVVARAPGVVEL